MTATTDSPILAPHSPAMKRRLSPSVSESENVKRTRLDEDDTQRDRYLTHERDQDKENARSLADTVRRSRSPGLVESRGAGNQADPSADAVNSADRPNSSTATATEQTGQSIPQPAPTQGSTKPDGRAHPPQQASSGSRPGAVDDRSRSKRLFGSLLGTLAKANNSSDLAIQRRRADIERKQQLRVRQQTYEEDEKRQARLRKLYRIRRREHWDFEKRVLSTRHEQMTVTAAFLQTKTEPKIYFRPKILLEVEEDIIDDQLDDVEAQIDSELEEFERRRALARSQSFVPGRGRGRGRDRDRGFGYGGGGSVAGALGGAGGMGGRRGRRGGDSWKRERDIDYTAGGRGSLSPPGRAVSRSRSPSRSRRQDGDRNGGDVSFHNRAGPAGQDRDWDRDRDWNGTAGLENGRGHVYASEREDRDFMRGESGVDNLAERRKDRQGDSYRPGDAHAHAHDQGDDLMDMDLDTAAIETRDNGGTIPGAGAGGHGRTYPEDERGGEHGGNGDVAMDEQPVSKIGGDDAMSRPRLPGGLGEDRGGVGSGRDGTKHRGGEAGATQLQAQSQTQAHSHSHSQTQSPGQSPVTMGMVANVDTSKDDTVIEGEEDTVIY